MEKALFLRLVTIILSISFHVPAQGQPPKCTSVKVTEQNVSDSIFSLYGSWARPVRNVSRPVKVNISLALSSINDVIEKSSILKVTGYIRVTWYDQFRVWKDKFPLNCVTYVVVPWTSIWLPDVAMMNAERRYLLMNLDGEKARMYSDGFTVYSPGGTFTVFCDYDLTMFPFDEQYCAIKFESWRYTNPFMTFNFGTPPVSLYQWLDNEQWELVNVTQRIYSVSYFEAVNTYDRVEFCLHIRRKSRYYLVSIIIPGLIIALAQLAVFALPVDEVQKVAILFTCLLAYLVFMLMIVGDVPRSSDHVPLLSIYIDVSMALIAGSILTEGIVFYLLRRTKSHRPEEPRFAPAWLEKSSLILAKLLGIRPYYHLNNDVNVKPKEVVSSSASASTTPGDMLNYSRYSKVGKPVLHPTRANGVNPVFQTEASPYSGAFLTQELKSRNQNTQQKNSLAARKTIPAAKASRNESESSRLQWHFIANVIDRFTWLGYGISIFVVPLIMFVILPNCASKLSKKPADSHDKAIEVTGGGSSIFL